MLSGQCPVVWLLYMHCPLVAVLSVRCCVSARCLEVGACLMLRHCHGARSDSTGRCRFLSKQAAAVECCQDGQGWDTAFKEADNDVGVVQARRQASVLVLPGFLSH